MLTFYNVRNGNSRYSRTIVKMVSESLKLIAKFPQMYRAVDAEEIVNVRVFHCDYFLIYYKVCETEIIVEAVFDTRQNPATLPYWFLAYFSYHTNSHLLGVCFLFIFLLKANYYIIAPKFSLKVDHSSFSINHQPQLRCFVIVFVQPKAILSLQSPIA